MACVVFFPVEYLPKERKTCSDFVAEKLTCFALTLRS